MAALTAVCRWVRSGEEVVAGSDLYGGTYRLLTRILSRQGIGLRLADITSPESVARAMTDRTTLVLVETPTNPLAQVADLRALAKVVHAGGALLAVDNSLMTPLRQQPLALGADVVVHSATKFLGGHGDVTAGAVLTSHPELIELLGLVQNGEGTALAPFPSWLVLRGLATLAVRLRQQEATTAEVAHLLDAHPVVRSVYTPHLASHPGRALHLSQATGCGAVLAFTTGDRALSERIVDHVKHYRIAVSFGSVLSTISLPCSMSHASIPDAERTLPDDLIRISLGVEATEDLVADLRAALDHALTGDRSQRQSRPFASGRG
jgi:cystathionine beta-lyase